MGGPNMGCGFNRRTRHECVLHRLFAHGLNLHNWVRTWHVDHTWGLNMISEQYMRSEHNMWTIYEIWIRLVDYTDYTWCLNMACGLYELWTLHVGNTRGLDMGMWTICTWGLNMPNTVDYSREVKVWIRHSDYTEKPNMGLCIWTWSVEYRSKWSEHGCEVHRRVQHGMWDSTGRLNMGEDYRGILIIISEPRWRKTWVLNVRTTHKSLCNVRYVLH
jgi:hypothetical protein